MKLIIKREYFILIFNLRIYWWTRLAFKKKNIFFSILINILNLKAAILAQNCIKKVEIMEYQELGMEAIFKIEVENFPCFIVVDNKGNDFFKEWQV
jgi:tartrate dehydratase beta subunit/fumarate hydratase class I family protein